MEQETNKDRSYKRQIGEELLRFCSGEELKVTIHAVSNDTVAQVRKDCRTVTYKRNKVDKAEFNDPLFYKKLASLSMGVQVSIEDLAHVDNMDWAMFYNKYFELDQTKKVKSPDIQDSKQDSESQN